MSASLLLISLSACGVKQLDCADGFYRDDAGNCLVIWPEDTGAAVDTAPTDGGGTDGSTDGGTDGGTTDGGTTDGGTDGGTTDGGTADAGTTDAGTTDGGDDTGPPEELSTTVTGRILDTNNQLKSGFEGSVWVFPAENVDHGVPDLATALAGGDLTWDVGGDVEYSLSFTMTEGTSDSLIAYALFRDTYYGSSAEFVIAAGSTRSGVDVDVIHFLTPGDGGSPGDGGTDTGLLEVRIGGEMEDLLEVVEEGDTLDIVVYLFDEIPVTGLPWEGGLEPVATSAVTWAGDGTTYEVSFEEFAAVEQYYKVYARHPLVYGAATEINLGGGDTSLNRDIRLDTYLGP